MQYQAYQYPDFSMESELSNIRIGFSQVSWEMLNFCDVSDFRGEEKLSLRFPEIWIYILRNASVWPGSVCSIERTAMWWYAKRRKLMIHCFIMILNESKVSNIKNGYSLKRLHAKRRALRRNSNRRALAALSGAGHRVCRHHFAHHSTEIRLQRPEIVFIIPASAGACTDAILRAEETICASASPLGSAGENVVPPSW